MNGMELRLSHSQGMEAVKDAFEESVGDHEESEEKFENDNEYQVCEKGKSNVESKSAMVDTKLPNTDICSDSKGLNIKLKRKYIENDSKKHRAGLYTLWKNVS